MAFHSRLRTLLLRLRSMPARSITAAGMLVIAALLAAAGIGMLSLPWQAQGPAAEQPIDAPVASVAHRDDNAATSAARMLPSPPPAIEPIDRLSTGVNADEISRQLADLPAGRWSYAFRSADGRPSAAAIPPRPRVIPILPASALGFAWPLDGAVTSVFDDRHPLGIDIAPTDPLGLVLAAREGTVIVAGGDPCCGYGYFVMLDHGDGITSIYGHLREAPSFQPGEPIERGTVLGVAGDTGHSYGVHLHFEVRVDGIPVDPEAALTGGHLTPLPSRIPTETPSAPDPLSGDPHVETPVPETVEPANVEPSPSTEDATPTPLDPTPAVTSSATPTASTPPATPVPSGQTATAQPTPAVSPAPTVTATVSRSERAATPGPSATPTAARLPVSRTPTPPATGSPSPSPGSSPSPRCDIVRFPATDGFIALQSDGTGHRSLVAERCGADASIAVVVRPVADHRCTADLVHQDDVRRLIPAPASRDTDDSAMHVTRWLIEADGLHPGATVRVACHPASLPE